MARALIKINGVDGSNDDLPINTIVQLGNDGNGGEISYAWLILDQPEGAADTLSSTSIGNPTFTPKKEGTYVLQLTVNGSIIDQRVAAIRQLKSGDRIPGAEETTEDDPTKGWKPAVNAMLQHADNTQADANRIVAQSFGGAVANKICLITDVQTIKAGLPGEEIVPKLSAAGGGSSGPLAIIEGAVRGGSPSSTLVYARVFGLVPGTFAGDPAVGDPVYVDAATSLPTLVAAAQRAGFVVEHDGVGHTYRWVIDGHANAVADGSSVFVAGVGAGSAIQNNGTSNTAAGVNSLAAGEGSTASGDNSLALGQLCLASGINSTAIGDRAHATAQDALAIGDGAHATARDAIAIGDGALASGTDSMALQESTASGATAFATNTGHATGDGSAAVGGNVPTASGEYAFATGNLTTSSGTASFAWGNNTIASEYGSAAGGDTCVASGYASFAMGAANTASGAQSAAFGIQAIASRENQVAIGGGRFSANGDAQTSLEVLRGKTPGAGANEAIELKYGFGATPADVFSCEDNKAYFLEVDCVAGGTQAGPTRVCQAFKQRYIVRRAAGVTTLAATGAADVFGDAAAATWTLVATIGAAPDRVVFTFNTGAGANSLCHVVLKLAFTEVVF